MSQTIGEEDERVRREITATADTLSVIGTSSSTNYGEEDDCPTQAPEDEKTRKGREKSELVKRKNRKHAPPWMRPRKGR